MSQKSRRDRPTARLVSPPEQRGERVGAIYRALRQAIMEQAIEPGMKLPEDTIGERFGVSRTIARRALELLAADELVEIAPNRGAMVAKPSREEAMDVFSVRKDIEDLVVHRLCGKLSGEQIQRLERHILAEERALSEDSSEYNALSAEFHFLLAEMSGSPLLERYMRQLLGRSALILGLYGRPRWTTRSHHEHRDLLRAIVSGDESRLKAMMHEHLDAVLVRALEGPATAAGSSLMAVLAPYADGLHSRDVAENGARGSSVLDTTKPQRPRNAKRPAADDVRLRPIGRRLLGH